MRAGLGFDAHAFDDKRPLVLGGVVIPDAPGLAGHSDADVVCHAIADALLGGAKESFEPIAPPRVTIYVCGPTVYDVPHAGHARMAIVFDVLRRHLMWRGFDVFFVRNVTDVDDKIIAKAKELGVDPAVVAERFTQDYDDVMRRANVLPPDVAPRASGHITEMVELISRLID